MSYQSTVLIVDDDHTARDTLEAILLPEGYELSFAQDGPQALRKAAKLTPDLILLDVMMPGMDGFEVCRQLRADSLLAQVPVIMVTALDDYDSRLRGIESGADEFISKPFDSVELQARVRNIIRLNRYRHLLSERAKFEWVVEQADDGYLMLDEQDHLLYANPQARLYLDLPPGRPLSQASDETFLDLARNRYQLESQPAWANWPDLPADPPLPPLYLVQPESPTANAFWLQVHVLDLPPGVQASRVIRLRNVTSQIDLQRDINGFHQAIVHKLRTPLTTLIGGLELLTQYVPTMEAEQIAQFTEMSLKGAQRLHGEIETILYYLDAPALARQGSGCPLPQVTPLLARIGHELELASLKVTDFEEPSQVRLALSERGVELVFWEILENAKKFHPQGAPSVEVYLAPWETKGIYVQIIDDGLSLSPEQLALAWTPYYQGEKDFTGEIAGLGLGLSTVAFVIWQVGGTCRLCNRQDQSGVIVELFIPWEVKQKETDTTEQGTPVADPVETG